MPRSQKHGALLSCPQEPPEDDANIIEKILASRMVQKEVSGKDVSGAGSPWAEERWDLATLCSIPHTHYLQSAAGVCPDWHLSGLGITVVP